MQILTAGHRLKRYFAAADGAVTVDWVVLCAVVVGLLGAGYGFMREGTTDLSAGISTYMSTYDF